MDGYSGVLDYRAYSIREAKNALIVPTLAQPELSVQITRLSVLAERIVRRLMVMHDILSAQEEACDAIRELLEALRERSSEIPRFDHAEARSTARSRYGLEQYEAELMKELRESERKWLEVRTEGEEAVAELLTDYADILAKIELVAQIILPRPTLHALLGFLDEPRSRPVLIIPSPKEVKAPPARIP